MSFLIQVGMLVGFIAPGMNRQGEIVVKNISEGGVLASFVGEGVQDVGIKTDAPRRSGCGQPRK